MTGALAMYKMVKNGPGYRCSPAQAGVDGILAETAEERRERRDENELW
jgi:hypothetical protein